MTNPMYDLPEHFPMPVNAEGNGPVTDAADIAMFVCWCSDSLCERFLVSGEAYREAMMALITGRGIKAEHAELIMTTLIQLGWDKPHKDHLEGALRRAEALAAGDPNWAGA